jgi:hypothetical protein
MIAFFYVFVSAPCQGQSPTIVEGIWKGTHEIEFTVASQSHISSFTIKFTMTGNCSGSVKVTVSGTMPISNGSFTINVGGYNSTGSVTGIFSPDGKSVSGTFTYTSGSCQTLNDSWSATPGSLPTPPQKNWAQTALGGGYSCTVMVTNQKTDTDWKGTIGLKTGNNQPWEGSWSSNGEDQTGNSEIGLAINPGGTTLLKLEGDQTTRSGYLAVGPNSGYSTDDISVSYFYEFWNQNQLLDSIGSPPSQGGTSFIFPFYYYNVAPTYVDTGVAWCSDSTESFDIEIILIDQSGNEIARKTVSFKGHEAQFLGQLFSENLQQETIGHARIQAARKIYLEVLRFFDQGGKFQLTSTPPSVVP